MRSFRVIPALLLATALASSARGQKVYWTQFDPSPLGWQIFRANLDGAFLEPVVRLEVFDDAVTFALDIDRGKIYYPSHADSAILHANLDGSQAATLVSIGVDGPKRLARNSKSDLVYWTEMPVIKRFGLGFDEPQPVIFGETMKDLALDPASDALYWAEFHNETTWCEELEVAPCYCLHRASADGSNPSVVHCEAGNNCFRDIELHLATQRVFWLNPGAYQIRSANLDGSDPQTILTIQDGLNMTKGITVDPVRNKLYWFGYVSGSWYWFHESELDGSNPRAVFLVPRPGYQGAMALDPRSPGDRDFSGRVDLRDFAAFQNCFGLDRSGEWAACSFFDVDPADGVVDSIDAVAQVHRLSGPG